MLGLGKLFKKGINQSKLIENRDYMQALLAASLLVAAADGTIEDEELKKLNDLLAQNPRIQHFGAELTDTLNRYAGLLRTSFRSGKNTLMREISDIKAELEDKQDLICMMLDIAEADGEIEPAEEAVMREICSKLGLRLEDFK